MKSNQLQLAARLLRKLLIVNPILIYIFVKNDIPLSVREEIIKPLSSRFEIGGEYFGAGDELLFLV